MDIEWAKDGHTGELFIVQARPETVRVAQGSRTCWNSIDCKKRGHVLAHRAKRRRKDRDADRCA